MRARSEESVSALLEKIDEELGSVRDDDHDEEHVHETIEDAAELLETRHQAAGKPEFQDEEQRRPDEKDVGECVHGTEVWSQPLGG